MRIAVMGAGAVGGYFGGVLANQSEDVTLIAGIGEKGIFVVENIEDALKDCDVIIDFTTPESTIKTLNAAVSCEKSIVIGTTGFSAEQKK